jgi:spore photoproduct lyase
MIRYKSATIDRRLAATSAGAKWPFARVTDAPPVTEYREGKRRLHITGMRGELFHICSSLDARYICCSTHVFAPVSNCPFECTYCFLQNYLTNGTTLLLGDTGAVMAEIEEKTALEPWRFFRIGTWELGDSIAVPPVTDVAAGLVKRFSRMPNALLKLRTKGRIVEPLLDIDHRGRTVISWTVNPEEVISREEAGTASMAGRIEAMKRASDAGYPVGLHFDPMIWFPGWEDAYNRLVDAIYNVMRPEDIIWISIGSLRFNPEMKMTMENNYPASRITSAEMVLGDDNKYRYVRPLRAWMYRHLLERLEQHGACSSFVYLCMERWNMWDDLFDDYPESIGELDFRMTHYLYRRYPGLVHCRPERELYLKAGKVAEGTRGGNRKMPENCLT